MDKSTKINWAKRALFLLSFVAIIGFLPSPTPLSKADTEKVEVKTENSLKSVPTTAEAVTPPQVDVKVETPTAPVPTTVVTDFKTTAGSALKIPAINLNIALGRTGLDKNRALMVPVNPNNAAWYVNGPKPGNTGSALITGHLDSAAGPGIFYNLRKLQAGDRIEVRRDDGKIAVFQVQKLASYAQDVTFPWNLVYSTSGPATLRIITCDGTYSPKTGHYSRNLVVYASLISVS